MKATMRNEGSSALQSVCLMLTSLNSGRGDYYRHKSCLFIRSLKTLQGKQNLLCLAAIIEEPTSALIYNSINLNLIELWINITANEIKM